MSLRLQADTTHDMHVRKLLDWRKLLIYSHRWLGIAVGQSRAP
jgi:hypothetical protein